jgi:hypothetical protein
MSPKVEPCPIMSARMCSISMSMSFAVIELPHRRTARRAPAGVDEALRHEHAQRLTDRRTRGPVFLAQRRLRWQPVPGREHAGQDFSRRCAAMRM